MSFEEYFGGWVKVIDKKELNNVVGQVSLIRRDLLCPAYTDIFKAFNLCSYDSLKVVMIGQDPYPQEGVATGILFGNKEGTELSPSLKIVKEACINFEIPHNSVIFDPTLESWAKQGVLMINSALTCEVNKVGSHTMMWRPFMTKLLRNLSEINTGIIYVLFGENAKTLKPYINSKSNIILEEKHPAYYARIENRMPSTVFEEVSKLTKEKYNEPIIWFKEY
ncbi:uracil-DNA glycosylase [uncultured phage cr106_1]|uniref:Uracil-DNA glycosylase n=1 Tax=uncultured phage cr106_1 TaxID=2772062 RepID=A0A7M1RZ72_9CAUD|nr:uracil-DNA glycosylase [uncultured phage cr106_1]QOR58320.1 uracil-DNA glycosylase [uncultured phage cr106_1]